MFETSYEDLSDLELLALAVGPDHSPARAFEIAICLIQKADSVPRLADLAIRELMDAGLSKERSQAFLAAACLFRRARQVQFVQGQRFRSSVEVFQHFEYKISHLKKECFWTLLLDGKNRLLRIQKISEGTLTSSLAHPREVYRPAILEAAAAVLFVHNHPSGDPDPSEEDMRLTKRLVETGKIVGIRVLDHVIIGRQKYFSFADQGIL